MTENAFTPPVRLTIRLAKFTEPVGALSAVFELAADTIAPGQPAKAVGDLFLAQVASGQQVVVSLGKAEKIIAETFRVAGASLARWLAKNNATQVSIDLNTFNPHGITHALTALCEGLYLGSFQFKRYKKAEGEEVVTTVLLHNAEPGKHLAKMLERVSSIVAAVDIARDWGHEPANVINPITLAERVSLLAKANGLKIKVLDEQELEKMGAGGIVNVGKGSATPSRLIALEYPGKGAGVGKAPVVLVGKALTFDSGGYSLKSVENIVTMKYDKCGGVTVAALMQAVSALGFEQPVVGLIGAAENMVSENAYRPDDILRMLSGKTVEIISTDAEGRLVLADVLTYAQQNYKPRAIIDLATLTGGVVVALGRLRGGLMANNDELANQLFASGERTHERLWRLPLDEEYAKLIQGDDADIKNSGGREGHAILGGMFLKQFVSDDVPWAHLDIAGVADANKELPYSPKGATGFGVRLLLDYLENLA